MYDAVIGLPTTVDTMERLSGSGSSSVAASECYFVLYIERGLVSMDETLRFRY